MRLCLHVLKCLEERDVPGYKSSSHDSKIITWKMRESITGENPSQPENCTDSQQFQMEARQWRNRNWQWSFGIDCHTDDPDESDEDEDNSGVRHYTYTNYCHFTFYLHDQDHHKRKPPPPSAQVARKRTSWWHYRLPLPSFLRNVRLEILVQFGNSFILLKDIYRRQDILCGDEAYFQFEKSFRIPAEVCNRLMNTSKDQVQVTVYGVTKDVQQLECFGSVVAPLKSAGSKWEVFLGQQDTDVTILASGGELIECHSNYISRNSPVLSKEFFSDGRGPPALVELLDLTRIQVEAFLRYQYNESAELTLEEPTIPLGVLKAAERFEIRGMWRDTIKCLLEKNSDWFESSAAQELVDFLDKCSKRDEEATQNLIRKLSHEIFNQRKENVSGIGYRKETGENRETGGNEVELRGRNLGTLLTKPKKSKSGELGKMLESQWTSLSLLKITQSEGYEDIRDDIIAALIVKDRDWFEGDFALELMNFMESCDEIRFQKQTWNLKKRLSLMLKEHSKSMEGTSGVAKQVVTNKAVKRYNSGSRHGNSEFQNQKWKQWTNDVHNEELAKMLESKPTSLFLLKVAQSYQNDELWNEIVTALLVKDSDWFEGESALELPNFLGKCSKPGDEATRTLIQKITKKPKSQSGEEKSRNGGGGENEDNCQSNEHIEDLLDTGDNDAEFGRQNLDAMKQRGIENLVKMLDFKRNSVSLLEVTQGFQNDEMWNNVIEAVLEKDCDWFEKDLALELMNLLRTCRKRNEEATQRLRIKLSQLLEQPSAIEEPGEDSEQAARSETTDQDKQNGHSRTMAPKRRKRKAVNQEQLPEFDSGNTTAGGLPKSAAVNVKPRRSARLESVKRKTEGFGTEDESGKNSLQLSKQRKEFVWRTGKKFYGPRDIRKDPALPKIAIIPDPALKVEKLEPLDEASEDSAGMHSAELQNHVAQEQDDVAAEEEMEESSVNNDDDGDYGVIKLDLEEDD